jgi:hypothetical protein
MRESSKLGTSVITRLALQARMFIWVSTSKPFASSDRSSMRSAQKAL